MIVHFKFKSHLLNKLRNNIILFIKFDYSIKNIIIKRTGGKYSKNFMNSSKVLNLKLANFESFDIKFYVIYYVFKY